MNSRDVILVGAGPAGMSAALTLGLARRHVRVFEVSDRVGGRVRTVPVGSCVSDGGALFPSTGCRYLSHLRPGLEQPPGVAVQYTRPAGAAASGRAPAGTSIALARDLDIRSTRPVQAIEVTSAQTLARYRRQWPKSASVVHCVDPMDAPVTCGAVETGPSVARHLPGVGHA